MGGRRELGDGSGQRHRAWENDAFRAYAFHMDSPEFREALASLKEISQCRKTAFMCSETLWWRCHRRLVADALVAEGFEVLHLGMGETQSHRMTKFARLDENGLLAYDGAPADRARSPRVDP